MTKTNASVIENWEKKVLAQKDLFSINYLGNASNVPQIAPHASLIQQDFLNAQNANPVRTNYSMEDALNNFKTDLDTIFYMS
jgi:hypothetical protein